MMDLDYPAPEAHTPRVRDTSTDAYHGLVLEEVWTQTELKCANPMEVRR